MCIRIFDKILKYFYAFRLFAYFDKRSDEKAFFVELNDVVGPVHINKDLFFVKLVVFIAHHIVNKRFFWSAEVTAKYKELALVFKLKLLLLLLIA